MADPFIPNLEPIEVADLTEATLMGSGVFDVLMRATKEHLEQEYTKGRIKGPEYSTVYLGSMTQVLGQSVQFLLTKDKAAYEAEIARAQVALTEAQIRLIEKQIEKEDRDAALIAAQTAKIIRETAFIDTQEEKVLKEIDNLVVQRNLLVAQVNLAQSQRISTDAQSALVIQKTATEKAQTRADGVDADSMIGKQKCLFQAQTDGFIRDAEQRAAKLMVDTWNVRRTTDEGTVADATNLLNDATIGKAITKLLGGIGVST